MLVEYPLIIGSVAYFNTQAHAVAAMFMLPLLGGFAAKHWNDAFGLQARPVSPHSAAQPVGLGRTALTNATAATSRAALHPSRGRLYAFLP